MKDEKLIKSIDDSLAKIDAMSDETYFEKEERIKTAEKIEKGSPMYEYERIKAVASGQSDQMTELEIEAGIVEGLGEDVIRYSATAENSARFNEDKDIKQKIYAVLAAAEDEVDGEEMAEIDEMLTEDDDLNDTIVEDEMDSPDQYEMFEDAEEKGSMKTKINDVNEIIEDVSEDLTDVSDVLESIDEEVEDIEMGNEAVEDYEDYNSGKMALEDSEENVRSEASRKIKKTIHHIIVANVEEYSTGDKVSIDLENNDEVEGTVTNTDESANTVSVEVMTVDDIPAEVSVDVPKSPVTKASRKVKTALGNDMVVAGAVNMDNIGKSLTSEYILRIRNLPEAVDRGLKSILKSIQENNARVARKRLERLESYVNDLHKFTNLISEGGNPSEGESIDDMLSEANRIISEIEDNIERIGSPDGDQQSLLNDLIKDIETGDIKNTFNDAYAKASSAITRLGKPNIEKEFERSDAESDLRNYEGEGLSGLASLKASKKVKAAGETKQLYRGETFGGQKRFSGTYYTDDRLFAEKKFGEVGVYDVDVSGFLDLRSEQGWDVLLEDMGEKDKRFYLKSFIDGDFWKLQPDPSGFSVVPIDDMTAIAKKKGYEGLIFIENYSKTTAPTIYLYFKDELRNVVSQNATQLEKGKEIDPDFNITVDFFDFEDEEGSPIEASKKVQAESWWDPFNETTYKRETSLEGLKHRVSHLIGTYQKDLKSLTNQDVENLYDEWLSSGLDFDDFIVQKGYRKWDDETRRMKGNSKKVKAGVGSGISIKMKDSFEMEFTGKAIVDKDGKLVFSWDKSVDNEEIVVDSSFTANGYDMPDGSINIDSAQGYLKEVAGYQDDLLKQLAENYDLEEGDTFEAMLTISSDYLKAVPFAGFGGRGEVTPGGCLANNRGSSIEVSITLWEKYDRLAEAYTSIEDACFGLTKAGADFINDIFIFGNDDGGLSGLASCKHQAIDMSSDRTAEDIQKAREILKNNGLTEEEIVFVLKDPEEVEAPAQMSPAAQKKNQNNPKKVKGGDNRREEPVTYNMFPKMDFMGAIPGIYEYARDHDVDKETVVNEKLKPVLDQLRDEVLEKFNARKGPREYSNVYLLDLKNWDYPGELSPRKTANPHDEHNEKLINSLHKFVDEFWEKQADENDFIKYLMDEQGGYKKMSSGNNQLEACQKVKGENISKKLEALPTTYRGHEITQDGEWYFVDDKAKFRFNPMVDEYQGSFLSGDDGYPMESQKTFQDMVDHAIDGMSLNAAAKDWSVYDEFGREVKTDITKREASRYLWDEGSMGWYMYDNKNDETLWFDDMLS